MCFLRIGSDPHGAAASASVACAAGTGGDSCLSGTGFAFALRAFGGVFCYFYYPAQQHDAAERSNLAARLEQLLETYRLGYSIGSAFGSEYNYLDMIIFDEPVFRAVFQDTEAVLGTSMFLDYFGGHGIQ